MKNAFTYMIVLLMSALVLYGGAGINVISYCCNDCRSAGIEAIANHKCCEIHEHNHSHAVSPDHAYNSCISHSQNDCCGIERFSYDWSPAFDPELDIEPVTIDLLFAFVNNIHDISSPISNDINSLMPTGPPIRTPRIYLSYLTTLLI